MDHIPSPSNPVRPPVVVPSLSDVSYDGLDFDSYPSRRGWDVARLLAGDFTQHGDQDTAAFLQDWLYFGTLATVLGPASDKASYVKTHECSEYGRVDTTVLPQHLHERLLQIKVAVYDQTELAIPVIQSAEKCLQRLSYMCCMANARVDSDELDEILWPLPPEVDLSLRVLGQTLVSSFYGVFMSDFVTRRLPETALPQLQFPAGRLLASTMRAGGWCLSDVSMLSQGLSPSTMYYISMMKRAATTRDHSNCTGHKCLAFQIDDASYKTKHCDESCDCSFVGPRIEDVVRIIKDGGTPLMSISLNEASGDVEIKTEAYKSGQEYVCFSHVWSDGMGNATENKLPKCQIARLKGLLDEVAGMKKSIELLNKGRFSAFVRKHSSTSTRFWLDTLCVPVQEEHKDIRKLAIRRMNDVYRKSYQLLVLDAELQQIEVPDRREALLRVSICGWMRRLWTLLEGVVGARAHIKFKDRIIDLEAVYEQSNKNDTGDLIDKAMNQSQGSLESDAVKFYWKMALFRRTIRSSDIKQYKIFGYELTVDPKFVGDKSESIKYDPRRELQRECHAIIEAFVASRWRTTSRKEDVYLCLANLLGWNTQDLSKLPVNRRMQYLLAQREDLPQGLIFVSGSRMEEQGWRWAVTEFDFEGTTYLDARIPINDFTPARRDESGLTVKYAGLMLPPTVVGLDGEELLISTADDAGTDTLKWWRVRAPHQPSSPLENGHTARHRLAVIFYDGRGNVDSPLPASVVMAAAVVSIADEEKGPESSANDPALLCTFLTLATVEVVGSVQEFAALRSRKDLNIRFVEDEAKLVRRAWTIQ